MTSDAKHYQRVLTIAGSDSGGAEQEGARAAFCRSVEYEVHFWEQAWQARAADL